MTDTDSNIEDARKGQKVNPGRLVEELQQAVTDGLYFSQRCNRADDVRFCKWDGQSEDGRKHAAALGRDPMPWEGASDQRIRTADEVVNDEVRMMLSSLRRAGFQTMGMGVEDVAQATRVTQLLRWQFGVAMRDQIRREVEMVAQWRQAYGASVTCIQWDQSLRRVGTEIGLEDAAVGLAAGALQMVQSEAEAAEVLAQSVEAILDPDQEELVIAGVRELYPLASRAEARRAIAAWRKREMAELDQPEIFGGGPKLTALQVYVDVFFPANTYDIQKARWVAHRELLTETELRDRVQTQDYDADWVEEAIGKKGQNLSLTAGGWGKFWGGQNLLSFLDESKDLIEIFHFYYKVSTPGGLPQVRRCVIHPGVPDMEAWSGELPYEHGKYPYVVHQREHLTRCILDSRGVPELADSWQQAVKGQHDSRVDRTSLTTLPPVLVPPTRGAMRLTFGPGVQWPKRRGEEIEWMRPPQFDGSSIEIERSTERMIDRYFGRISENNPPDRAMLYQQHLVDMWLGELEQVAAMVLQLDQQYLPEEVAIRVANGPIRLNREEIQGQFDLQMVFDVRNLNAELLKEKLHLINTMVLPLDRFGAVDLAKMVQFTLGAVDPTMADLVLQDVESASEQQVNEEQDILARMVAGMETPMEPGPGINYALRAQVLQEAVQKNPELQQMIQARPILQQMIEARLQFLTHQVQQQENAQTGRVGAQQVLE
jgi:hypothetical protein